MLHSVFTLQSFPPFISTPPCISHSSLSSLAVTFIQKFEVIVLIVLSLTRTVVHVAVKARLTWWVSSSSTTRTTHENPGRCSTSERPSTHTAATTHPCTSLTHHPTNSSSHKFIIPVVMLLTMYLIYVDPVLGC